MSINTTYLKTCGGEFVNVIMQKVRGKKSFWEDAFKHYKTVVWHMYSSTTDGFASECVYYNVNIFRWKTVIVLSIKL